MLLHNTAGWRRQGAERFYSTLRRRQRSDDPVCSLGTPNVVCTVWAFLLRICRGVMRGGIIVEGSTDAAKPFMGGNAWCYSVLPGLRCRTHAVSADGHSSGAEYGSMCVAHGNCATHVFCWVSQKEGCIAVACFPRQSITLRLCMPPSAAPLQVFAFVRNGERDCCGGGRMFPSWCFW
ncbi:hypothetical protein TcCL_NonESM11804 [Trypanosoma cruzi]|nr:hypothetical protein TcCL_NonESM11804 [Trypanosoma cruzi]